MINKNIPAGLSTKNKHLMLALIVPSRRQVKNMDVYLQPFINKFKQLWEGIQVYDVSTQDAGDVWKDTTRGTFAARPCQPPTTEVVSHVQEDERWQPKASETSPRACAFGWCGVQRGGLNDCLQRWESGLPYRWVDGLGTLHSRCFALS